jgi:cell division septal protein FtsQ
MKEMAMNSRKPTRADEVRRRRSQESKMRRTATRQSATVVRPLVSRPRVTGAPGRTHAKAKGRFELSLAGANPLAAMRVLPTLPRVRGSWRMVSASMVLLFVAMLSSLLADQRMYVWNLNLGGASLVPAEEIYKASGLARQHIFWVNPADVQQRLKAVSGIASAQVSMQWPNVVTVLVTEKVPVIKLVEGDKEWWVNPAGERFAVRGDVPGLLPIEVDDAAQLGGNPVPFSAIQGALQLRELRPNIERLHYDTQHGLSYQDGRNWRGYFGVGTDMAQKLAIYETLTDNLVARGIYPTQVSVEDIRAPFYRK